MKNHFDILIFIDSPDIAEYNTNTMFTPAEMAILICLSKRQTLKSKLEALEDLATAFSEKEFAIGNIVHSIILDQKIVSLKPAVEHKIQVWRQALQKRFDMHHAMFAAKLSECGFHHEEIGEVSFFDSYEKAYQFLKDEIERYEMDEDLSQIPLYAQIYRLKVNNPVGRAYSELYWLNRDLEITDIWEDTAHYYKEDGSVMPDIAKHFYVFVPLPFKHGSLIKNVSPYERTVYGFIQKDYDARDWDIRFEHGYGDASDMMLTLDHYDEHRGIWDETMDIDILSLQSCTDEEHIQFQKSINAWKKRFLPRMAVTTMNVIEKRTFDLISKKWIEILKEIHQKHCLTDVSYKTWIEPLKPLAFKGDTLVVGVPDDIMLQYVVKKYSDAITKSIFRKLQLKVSLEFIVTG